LPAETARDLVMSGPYAYVRNPMAVAGVAQVVGVGLWSGSWMVVAAGLTGAMAWDLLIRPTEEADLADRFGEPYRRYARHVRCWIPRMPLHDDW
jgi:protein-S-isoprenylcysteine O-methyltransferase Ste14